MADRVVGRVGGWQDQLEIRLNSAQLQLQFKLKLKLSLAKIFYKDAFIRELSVSGHNRSMQELFNKERYNKLVAVEPGLRVRYQDIVCGGKMGVIERSGCLLRRSRSLGKSSQLGTLVLVKGL